LPPPSPRVLPAGAPDVPDVPDVLPVCEVALDPAPPSVPP
jgi:hypothetical protein